MNEYVNINNMTLEERTTRYTARRIAELRGDISVQSLDSRTARYIQRRLAQLQGSERVYRSSSEHPYITRRLAELKKEGK
jgi:hypothetical protein